MANDLNGVIDSRLEKVEQELAKIEAKIKEATAPYIQLKAELTKQRNLYLELKQEAGILPPPKKRGNPKFQKKKE